MIRIKQRERGQRENIKLALIATYPKMSKIFMRIAEEENIEAINIFASFEDAVQYAKEIEDKVDAILSRGGTAAYIKRAVDIPVISIPISPLYSPLFVNDLLYIPIIMSFFTISCSL